jgi:hypothetical protein
MFAITIFLVYFFCVQESETHGTPYTPPGPIAMSIIVSDGCHNILGTICIAKYDVSVFGGEQEWN